MKTVVWAKQMGLVFDNRPRCLGGTWNTHWHTANSLDSSPILGRNLDISYRLLQHRLSESRWGLSKGKHTPIQGQPTIRITVPAQTFLTPGIHELSMSSPLPCRLSSSFSPCICPCMLRFCIHAPFLHIAHQIRPSLCTLPLRSQYLYITEQHPPACCGAYGSSGRLTWSRG
jgi:hypothetical protein